MGVMWKINKKNFSERMITSITEEYRTYQTRLSVKELTVLGTKREG